MTDGQELARALRGAYWAMHRRTNAILAGRGVTADQFVLLSRLADEDGVTQKELARRASSDPNTIGPMLRLLERAGFVAPRAHASDGRALCVLLTGGGAPPVPGDDEGYRAVPQADGGGGEIRKRAGVVEEFEPDRAGA